MIYRGWAVFLWVNTVGALAEGIRLHLSLALVVPVVLVSAICALAVTGAARKET